MIIIFLLIHIAEIYSFQLEEHQAAFVQTGDELHYLSSTQQIQEGAFTTPENNASHKKAKIAEDEKEQTLTFNPPLLNFGNHAVGIPHLRKIKVKNPTKQWVRFDAISGSSHHFHCSFFKQKVLEPDGSTTFDVVFLARSEGVIDTTLYIHSSLGTYKYSVSGVGASNPYRLRPFGARVPLNVSVSSPVTLHNPHPTPLRVIEMYTSGGDLHLEYPPSSTSGLLPITTWEIPPFRSKTLMTAKFLATRERNATTTAYIRIKTNQTDQPIIVPVDLEVTSEPGLYSDTDSLDFGTLRGTLDDQKTIVLNVYNAANKTLQISSVSSNPKNEALDVQVTQDVLEPAGSRATKLAKLTFRASKASRNKYSGQIVVKSKGEEYKLTVNYAVLVQNGNILHDSQELAFYAGHRYPLARARIRNITLTNAFVSPIGIYQLAIQPPEFAKYFEVYPLADPLVIPPNVPVQAFSVHYHGVEAWVDTDKQAARGYLILHSNMSSFELPMDIFKGRLRVSIYSSEEEEFNFGTLNYKEQRSVHFAVTNANPVPVTLENFMCPLERFTKLELLGLGEGNETVFLGEYEADSSIWRPKHDLTVPPYNVVLFRYSVKAPDDKATYHSSMVFKTKYERLSIPVLFRVEEGSIFAFPAKMVFEDAFPGKISYLPLQLFSTFTREMTVQRLSTLSQDPRFFFDSFEPDNPPVIRRNQMAYLGRAFFFPIAGCLDDCYIGLPLNSGDGYRWVEGARLPPNLPEIDSWLYSQLRAKWDAMVSTNEHIVNTTIVVDTTEVKGFPIPAQGRLVWPRLLKQSQVHFPLTGLNNVTIVNVTLHNPSSFPVIVQLLPLSMYPNPELLLQLLWNELSHVMTEYVEMDDLEMFSLRDCELYNQRPESPVPKFRAAAEEMLDTRLPRFTLSLALQPGMKVRIRLGFQPRDYDLRSSLLIIRNNLTIFELVPLYGRGGRAELRIGRMAPYSFQPLLFEVHDRQLRHCDNFRTKDIQRRRRFPIPVLVNRSFIARNTGEVPLFVSIININGIPCHNRGFRVMNCDPFHLKPNDTHVLEILFLPDFTQSFYEAALQLYITGSSSPFIYLLASSLPNKHLSVCQAALPRPPWEPVLYYVSVTALAFLLIFTVASAYLEGDRIVTCALKTHRAIQQQQQQQHARNVFDLKRVVDDYDREVAAEREYEKNSSGDSKRRSSDRNSSALLPTSAASGNSSWLSRTRLTNDNSCGHDPSRRQSASGRRNSSVVIETSRTQYLMQWAASIGSKIRNCRWFGGGPSPPSVSVPKRSPRDNEGEAGDNLQSELSGKDGADAISLDTDGSSRYHNQNCVGGGDKSMIGNGTITDESSGYGQKGGNSCSVESESPVNSSEMLKGSEDRNNLESGLDTAKEEVVTTKDISIDSDNSSDQSSLNNSFNYGINGGANNAKVAGQRNEPNSNFGAARPGSKASLGQQTFEVKLVPGLRPPAPSSPSGAQAASSSKDSGPESNSTHAGKNGERNGSGGKKSKKRSGRSVTSGRHSDRESSTKPALVNFGREAVKETIKTCDAGELIRKPSGDSSDSRSAISSKDDSSRPKSLLTLKIPTLGVHSAKSDTGDSESEGSGTQNSRHRPQERSKGGKVRDKMYTSTPTTEGNEALLIKRSGAGSEPDLDSSLESPSVPEMEMFRPTGMQRQPSSPFAVAAKLTECVVKKNKLGNSMSCPSESDESSLPEWDSPLVTGVNWQNFDAVYEQITNQSESFASLLADSVSLAGQKQGFPHRNSGLPGGQNNGPTPGKADLTKPPFLNSGRINGDEGSGGSAKCYSAALATNGSAGGNQRNVAPRFKKSSPSSGGGGGKGPAGTSGRKRNDSAMAEISQISSSSRSSSSSSADASGGSSSPSPKNRDSSVPLSTKSKKQPAKTGPFVGIIGSPPNRRGRLPKSPSKNRRNISSPPAGTPVTPDKYFPTANFSAGNGLFGAGAQRFGPTMMQELQAERRRRLYEYQVLKAQQKEEWPGFNLAPVAEHLWDDGCHPWNPSEPAETPSLPGITAELKNLWVKTTEPSENVDTGAWSTHTGDSPVKDRNVGAIVSSLLPILSQKRHQAERLTTTAASSCGPSSDLKSGSSEFTSNGASGASGQLTGSSMLASMAGSRSNSSGLLEFGIPSNSGGVSLGGGGGIGGSTLGSGFDLNKMAMGGTRRLSCPDSPPPDPSIIAWGPTSSAIASAASAISEPMTAQNAANSLNLALKAAAAMQRQENQQPSDSIEDFIWVPSDEPDVSWADQLLEDENTQK